jgi:outer membrane protein OmpA-like peptidoglycan-associated protein
VIAEKKTVKARLDFAAKQDAIVKSSQGALVKNREQLAEAQRGQAEQAREAGAERTARGEADRKAADSEQKAVASDLRATASEQKAADATDALAKLAAKEDERGTIITLSGSVLFRSNDSALLPAALTRLDQVAAALVAQGRSVVVEGYTDSKGSAAGNMTLSRLRAESVRSYLVSRGFPTERIESRGMGADRPVAANSTTEGRANNRRVEIVLTKTAPKLDL